METGSTVVRKKRDNAVSGSIAGRGSPAIEVYGARVHNLKNIDVSIPRNKLVVITGLSGSGKSSLAFDTIHAEGQRRYMETFSAYARHYLGQMERPDVDKITGLSPVIAIEQKTTGKNPRSTVGTITEIYDFLRLLYARTATAYSYKTGEKMVRYTDGQIISLIKKTFKNKQVMILAPLVRGRKGHYRELFMQMMRKGFLNMRIDGELTELMPDMKLNRYKTHYIELVVDKMTMKEVDDKRLSRSITSAMKYGDGVIQVWDTATDELRFFSRKLMCPTTGISYNEPAPHTFSFNSPQGACPVCNGLGTVPEADVSKIIPDPGKSIRKGAIEPLGPYKSSLIFWQLEAIAQKYSFSLDTPVKDIPKAAMDVILYGSEESFRLVNTSLGISTNYFLSFEGIINFILGMNNEENPRGRKKSRVKNFVRYVACPECKGARLKKEALYFRIHNKNIAELASMDISSLYHWIEKLPGYLGDRERKIASEVLKEIRVRLKFLLDVGVDYLSLDRSARTLSGGESQRIRLATQIGSKLVNVLYILDEPSIGLHQRDNLRLIHSLQQLRDAGNSVIVVEHDREMIMSADHVLDMGPLAGRKGGEVVAQGTPSEVAQSKGLTGLYLRREKDIPVPRERRTVGEKMIRIAGARGNNLKNIDVSFPLGVLICITGVSGSGKSTLLHMTLQRIIKKRLYRALEDPLSYDRITGLEHVDKVIEVDQSPLGRTPRSNPATYTGVFSDIRNLFAQTPEARVRGYKPGRFSFNVKGGRCEACQGAGVKTIEMNFLPDVYVHCDVCNGKRYNRETLQVKYKGKSISDVLNMTINEAVVFFENIPSIYQKLKTLQDVGLGYVFLGQPSTTLSGGESQRVKLAAELARKSTGKTLYILDEPTTGLHFADVKMLLDVLQSLVNRGNTVMVIEHNMDVIKTADYIIDLGPGGGLHGGEVVAAGTPEDIARRGKGFTARFLEEELKLV
ncbi:MAG: excinuclease ABC subunit UvrA [Bacteroidales bacterium]|nr:excinuclease ABC subunit UvrA [Bacteroidales bacterium]